MTEPNADYRPATFIRFVRKPTKPQAIYADISIQDFPEVCQQELTVSEAIQLHFALGRAIDAASRQ
jgi:hypothetical protein